MRGIKIGGGRYKKTRGGVGGWREEEIKREQKEQVSPCTKEPKKKSQEGEFKKNGRREEIIKECPCCF